MLEFDFDVAKVPETRLFPEMMRVTVLEDHLVCVSYISSIHCLERSIETGSNSAVPGSHKVAFCCAARSFHCFGCGYVGSGKSRF